ncbi:hypothetical protein [Lyngbya confervoides]|uniref:Uncharacterized protein n=1 Tax=Lyngbya confervoides BDU141951 TaxID=1574623 RepID=A0ABD4T7B1_9CYAN|nr:hypothetical protein [Lyngbya confervoides]MCM1984651.1 hypothetical protein [Lyngbya confervoides BDU141951]
MNPTPRRPRPLPLPLRGRLAAESTRRAEPVLHIIRQRPPISSSYGVRDRAKPHCEDLHPSFYAFYQRWKFLFKIFDRPEKWVGAIVLVVLLAFFLGLWLA